MAATCSEARILANRKNAQLARGPKTEEGKARSRLNAVKHGLTGAGIALPSEDAAAVEARFLEMQEQMQPSTVEGALQIRLAAFMSVRIDRCGRHERALLATARRHAADEFDLARLAEIDRLFRTIETNPREHHRRLQTTTEGIDLLLEALQGVRDQVELGLYKKWKAAQCDKIDCFLGGSDSEFSTSRADAVLFAIRGNYEWIMPRELDGIPAGTTRDQYFGDELIRLVDAERARLERVRGRIDPEVVALDRLEAADRVTLPDTPETARFRKYEAAAISGFQRALREFHRVEQLEAVQAPQTQKEGEVAAAVPKLAPAGQPAPAAVAPVAAGVATAARSATHNEPKPAPFAAGPNADPSILNYPTRQF